jgi:hypothetical protein
MRAKLFTLSVVVATVVGAVSCVSAQIDRQISAAQWRPVPVQTAILDPYVPVSTASPLDIDPRRMEAPGAERDTGTASNRDKSARTVRVSRALVHGYPGPVEMGAPLK